MQEKPRRLPGFTLIEVLVVVAIVGILSALVLTSLAGRRTERGLEKASHEVAGVLRQAQNYALSGRSANASEDNCSFSLVLAAGSTYSLTNSFGSGGVCASTGTIGSYALSEGVTFAAPATIGFRLPRGEVMVAGATLIGSYAIAVTKLSVSRYVCVYASGRILENGANATCP